MHGNGVCFLKNSTWASHSQKGAVSGSFAPPPAPTPTVASVTVLPTVVNVVDEGFKTWNIDASPNREWDTRDLSQPLLHSLGQQSLPGHLRFGGAGNDNLPYAMDMSDPSSAGNTCRQELYVNNSRAHGRCLNRTWVDNLAGFAAASDAKLVFGLNICVPNCSGVWDPVEAKALLTYMRSQNYTIFGVELGNEQNTHYTPLEAVQNFAVLQTLLTELYPDAATRPKLIGPDVHGFHHDPFADRGDDGVKLKYLHDFAATAVAQNLPLHAATHHEYVDVDQNPLQPPDAERLNITHAIAVAVNASLAAAAPDVQIWAGEIGPHNGGTVPCDHTSMRWANFADTFWYLDSMATKAADGYKVFCRQNFIGIDYGMLDCATHMPLPDYFGGILWSLLMGRKVLKVSSDVAEVRAYAHCATLETDQQRSGGASTPASVTVLLLNLDPATTINVTLALGGDGGVAAAAADRRPDGAQAQTYQRTVWHLTGPGGANGTAMALNGKLLVTTVQDGRAILPPLSAQPQTVTVGAHDDVVQLAAASIAFVQVDAAGAGASLAQLCQ